MKLKLDKRKLQVILIFAVMALMVFCQANMVFADPNDSVDLNKLITNLLNIVTTIFQAIGVILAAYSVGQLILAFKNDDADSKSRASSTLIVAAALISIPQIIKTLNLTQYIGSF